MTGRNQYRLIPSSTELIEMANTPRKKAGE